MTKTRNALAALALLLLLPVAGCATTTPAAVAPPPAPTPRAAGDEAPGADFAERARRIRDFVEERMRTEGAVGLTIGFYEGEFVWVEGFGRADLENDVPAKPESSYRMASVTKPMTAVGVLTLVEEGRIDLDAEVQEYVPYFPRKEHPITVRQLLGHLGGISHYRDYDAEGHFKEPKTTRESIAVFEDFELVAEPGTRYGYSTYGYNLLGAVIEAASGRSYGDYMTEHVWRPLGMGSTRMDDPRALIPHRVVGYGLVGGELKRSEYLDVSSRFAGGGTRSTVPDMLRFAKGLDEGKLLSDETRSRMWTALSTREGLNVGYGFGWSTSTGNGRFLVGHGGSQAETKTYLLVAPHLDFAAAVASNFEGTDPSAYAQKVFEIVIGEPWEIRHFARTAEERVLLRALDSAFDFSMRHHDQHRRPVTTDPAELADAFAYFAGALAAPPEEAAERFRNGVHPAAGEAFVVMVSSMADALERSGEDLDDYYRRGAIPLFHDYVDWYRGREDHPEALRFPPELESRLARWAEDWDRTWNDETRGIEIHAGTDLASLRERLTSTFRGASVYPDFTGELGDVVRDLVVAGEADGALAVAEAAVEIYPDSDDAIADLAILYLIGGQAEKAEPLFARAIEIDPEGAASAGSLNSVAYQLAGVGQPEAGLRVLEAAVRFHPEVANLYDSIGELHHRMGEPQKAIDFYSRALEVDPEYPNAEAARKILEGLASEGGSEGG